jgi:2-polyprenyl-6-methoxyphenol hydroxylase-like FAD-dependent oxidoreductase
MRTIAILGAGPIGLSMALMINKKYPDLEIHIYEMYSRDKIVEPTNMYRSFNIFIMPFVLRKIEESTGFRVENALPRTFPMKGFWQAMRGGNKTFVPVQSQGFHRTAIVKPLLELCEQTGNGNIKIIYDTCVVGVEHADNGVKLEFQNQSTSDIVFDVILDCSGVNSILRAKAIASGESIAYPMTEIPPYKYRVLSLKNCPHNLTVDGATFTDINDSPVFFPTLRLQYTGVPGSFYCICSDTKGMPEDWLDPDFDKFLVAFKKHIPELAPYIDEEQTISPIGSITPVYHSNLVVEKGRVIFVGDAAQATRPTMGQGINFGFREVIAFINALENENGDNFVKAGGIYEKTMLEEQKAVVLLSEEMISMARTHVQLFPSYNAIQAILNDSNVLYPPANVRLATNPDLLFTDTRANFQCEWPAFLEMTEKVKNAFSNHSSESDKAVEDAFALFILKAIEWKKSTNNMNEEDAEHYSNAAWVTQNVFPKVRPVLEKFFKK